MSFSHQSEAIGHPSNNFPEGYNLPACYYEHWDEGNSQGLPVAPRPDVLGLIRTTTMPYLDQVFFSNARIELFHGGRFHQLYRISSDRTRQEYLMRIALPCDPWYKTESEIATMSFVRDNSSVPVPNVIAYSSDRSGPVGFEWILMEKMNGVPYADVQARMSLSDKLNLAHELAMRMEPLVKKNLLTVFGSIYNERARTQLSTSVGLLHIPYYVVGPTTATRFTRDKRVTYNPPRGPFQTFQNMILAELVGIGKQMEHSNSATSREEREMALALFDRFQKHVVGLPLREDGPEDARVLWHNDLSARNVLVDPNTFRLAGVVDWQCTSVVPIFETGGMIPPFLRGPEVLERPEQRPNESSNSLAGRMMEWEKTQMRHKWVEVIGRPGPFTHVEEQWIVQKNVLRDNIDILASDYDLVRRWMDGTL